MIQSVQNIMSTLTKFTKDYEIGSLFVVGDYCRCQYLNRLDEVKKIEIVSAYPEQSVYLGCLFASESISVTPKIQDNKVIIQYSDANDRMIIEFQDYSSHSYMSNQEILRWLEENKVDNLPLINNVYGRDFTINSIVFSPLSETYVDLLGRAEEDFHKKLISTILPPDLLIKYSPLCILKGIKLSLLYDFYIEKQFRHEMQRGIDNLTKSVSKDRLMEEIIEIVNINAEKAIEIFDRLGMSKIISADVEQKILEIKNEHEERISVTT